MKYSGIGRRKSAVAQVFFSEIQPMPPEGHGHVDVEAIFSENIFINNKKIDDYFQKDGHVLHHLQQVFKVFGFYQHRPLKMQITVCGGGQTGQKEAIYLATARALSKKGGVPLQNKPNLLTQDTRKKERKKYGLKKARKAPQYSKR
uniref:Small ribosomal subunit protein uS9c n=1 Tax=Rhipilia penicilloides TaxID=1979422 RepID=A0A2P0QHQ4_9CHLO|nr:ribosomal protein S9 [Rhipilia penicilloides]ARO74290.1 ribosomal protein S9 [Rhipilia penicilloides]